MAKSNNSDQNGNKKTILAIEIIIFILILIILGVIGYFTYQFYKPKPQASSTPTTTPRPSASTKTSCASTLTSADKNEIELWKTYTNSRYNYTFKYPQTWFETAESKPEEVVLKDSSSLLEFKFLAANMSIADAGYTLIKETPVTVACVDATKQQFQGAEPAGEDKYILSTQFENQGTEFRVVMYYVNRGASITGDIIEAYDLILKTINFE